MSLLFFFVAFLYSSVGHGGASGYLAVFSFFAFVPAQMSTTALILNLLVAGIGFIAFYRAKHFFSSLTIPFLLTSVPGAFLGGLLPVSPHLYALLLAGILLFAAFRFLIRSRVSPPESHLQPPPLGIALPVGGTIGILSGIVGVGGGIFLSPIILLMNWADPKKTAAASACFIWVNSLAGLLGRWARGGIEVGIFAPLIATAFLGGLLGSYWGANRFSGWTIRRILGIVLLVASFKLILVTF
ncbi:sulfite exporter TauE/SafE family protein [candidate division TA06 bacterium]|nr:sulfite exporter TauE/SafE family protein [candidate division TA06 bacterium]